MNFACKHFEAFAPQNWFSVCDRSGGYACEAYLWYLQPQTLPGADVHDHDHDHEGGYDRVHARVSGRDRRQEHVRARVLVFAPEPDQQAAASLSHMILR